MKLTKVEQRIENMSKEDAKQLILNIVEHCYRGRVITDDNDNLITADDHGDLGMAIPSILSDGGVFSIVQYKILTESE